ncbi:hypothetical protein ACOMHN_038330 [Nucella lapillus]
MNNGWTELCLLLAGSVYFPLVYIIAKYAVTKYFKDRLSTGDIYFISERCMCSTQAVMTFSVGLIIATQVQDIMYDVHWLTNSYAWIALPYFVYDLRAMYLTYVWNHGAHVRQLPMAQKLRLFVKDQPLMIVHHTVMPMIIFPAVIFFRKNLGDFFVGTFYMIEITIPFIAVRAVLSQLNLKNTPYYIIFGLLMLFSFLFSRILVFPYLYWRYALYAGKDLLDVPASIPLKCNLGCLMLLLPQFYWFWLMFRGTVRVFYKMFIRWKYKSHD